MEKFAFTLLQLTVVSKLSSRDLVPNKLDPSLLILEEKNNQPNCRARSLANIFL